MPIEQVPGQAQGRTPGRTLTYALVAFDADGHERTDDPDHPSGLLSRRLAEVLADDGPGPVTDVFLMSHGWRGDVPSAREQYARWLTAMADCAGEVARPLADGPGFRPLVVGVHWPSEPFGDEVVAQLEEGDPAGVLAGRAGVLAGRAGVLAGRAGVLAGRAGVLAGRAGVLAGRAGLPSGLTACGGEALDDLVGRAAGRTADTPPARDALRTIVRAAQADPFPPALPPEVRAAYAVLDREAGLGCGGPAAPPGADRAPFDADAAYQAGLAAGAGLRGRPSGAVGVLGGGLLLPLRLLSFWTMKERARRVGEGGVHALLAALMRATGRRGVRFHLMGHSFGCIVVSAALAGPAGRGGLPRPVGSLVLVQGALSLWSYAAEIPPAPGQAGYFRSILAEQMVAGPIVATTSRHDTAVGVLYPYAAGVGDMVTDQVSRLVRALPRYGAVGAFGLQGGGLSPVELSLGPVSEPYRLTAGAVYNVECSATVRAGRPPGGAHSDIAHPEVAHLVWAAARGAA